MLPHFSLFGHGFLKLVPVCFVCNMFLTSFILVWRFGANCVFKRYWYLGIHWKGFVCRKHILIYTIDITIIYLKFNEPLIYVSVRPNNDVRHRHVLLTIIFIWSKIDYGHRTSSILPLVRFYGARSAAGTIIRLYI